MIQHRSKLEKVLPFFNKKPIGFQESFCILYGSDIRDETDVFYLTEIYLKIMNDKINNGKVLRREEIYILRGYDITLGSECNQHHWPPGSMGGVETMTIPCDFHGAWHRIYLNLYRKNDIKKYLERIFSDQGLDEFLIIYKIVDQIRSKRKENKRKGYYV